MAEGLGFHDVLCTGVSVHAHLESVCVVGHEQITEIRPDS